MNPDSANILFITWIRKSILPAAKAWKSGFPGNTAPQSSYIKKPGPLKLCESQRIKRVFLINMIEGKAFLIDALPFRIPFLMFFSSKGVK